MANLLPGKGVENMPERARVFVAEDEPDWQAEVREVLEKAGHWVVATALTRSEGLTIVAEVEELGVDVAAIDGNLSQPDTSGGDGQAIIAAIRELAPSVKTVGISLNTIPGADANTQKSNIGTLGKIVNDL